MYHILYNPMASKGKCGKAFTQISKYLEGKGIEYVAHATDYAGHAIEIARDLSNGENEVNLIIIGGDGTFSEVLNGIVNFDKVNLGLIPCGTGNDYAKKAGISTKPIEALENILNGKAEYTDFIQLNGRRCLNVAGAGMDVDVLVRYSTMKAFFGKIKYYASLIDVLTHLKFHKAKITIAGKEEERSVFLVAVANGTFIGGGMPISPNSDINDGLIDVVVVDEIAPKKVLPLLIKFLAGGKHVNEPCTTSYKVKECRVEILDEGKIQVDGEVLENKVLDAKIVSNTLKVIR